MKRVLQDERGMALALAIVALVIVGALVAGALFSGTQEERMADNTRFQQASFGAAEVGAYEALGGWNRVAYNSQRAYPLDSAEVGGVPWITTPNKTGSFGGYVYKLNNNLYLIDITGRDTMSRASRIRGEVGGARERIGVIGRILPLNVDVQAALTVGGPVVFGGGNVFVKGQDTPPPPAQGWSCGPADTTKAGVRAKAPGDVVNSSGQVTGNPNVLITPAMDSTTFTQFGATNYAQLAGQANIILSTGSYAPAPVVTGGVCTTSVVTNWGDGNMRTNPCGNYFPIVHGTGDITLTNGQGQGVLLIDGNLTAGGSFTFYGLLIVRGSFSTVAGGSPKIFGAVLAQSMNFSTTAFNGDAVINWSKCAVQQSLQWTGIPALSRSRSWVQLY
jgi:hypothetical protein